MKALDTQVGGEHYKSMKIQPMEYSMANGLDACQHTVVKYVSRFRDKGGIDDLRKAIHCIEMLIDFERDNSASATPHYLAFDEERMDAIGRNGNDGLAYPDADGWNVWSGGECPVAPDTLVDVRFAGAGSDDTETGEAITFGWEHEDWLHPIIAYRIVQPKSDDDIIGR